MAKGPDVAYQTFALKYRPQTFDEIVGQDHVATTLKNAVIEGRVAHGYLFAGPRGTGKTSTARVLAKSMCCETGPTPSPCCSCSLCQAFTAGSAMDLIEIDAASNRGIDDIRELRERVGYAPTQARCKFYILDEAHMLTPAAANALLKTLEEPPPFVYFVLATTELHNILPTIRSRCQTFEFRPIPQIEIVRALQHISANEGVQADEAALGAIARASGGAMRDAESIFDQVIAYGRGAVTLEIVNSILGVTDAELLTAIGDAVARDDITAVFRLVDETVASGKDIDQLLEDLSLYFRDLLRISLGAAPPEWMRAAGGNEVMQAQAAAMGPKRLGDTIEELGEASARVRDTAQKPLLLEVTLAHMASVPAQGPVAPMPPPAPKPEPAAPQPTASAPQPAPEPPAPEPPAPEPAAPAAPQPPPAELTLDAVREGWPRVMEALSAAGHASVAAVISSAEPCAFESGRVTLRFPADSRFEYERARDAYVATIADAAQAALGRAVEIICQAQEAAPPSVNPPEAAEGSPEARVAPEQPRENVAEAAPATEEPSAEQPAPTTPANGAAEKQQQLVQGLLLEFDGTEDTSG